MGGIDEDDDEIQQARDNTSHSVSKRTSKAQEKEGKKSTYQNARADRIKSRIGKLSLKKGAIAMFAVCEIGNDYLIVNHTRNVKGYLPLGGTGIKSEQFRLGQLIVACVNAEIGGASSGDIYNFKKGSAGLNRKI